MHEASLWDDNCFITLTYRPECLPPGRTLVVKHFQRFMKRLRKYFEPKVIRFYQCGEYGEECINCAKNRKECKCSKFIKTLGRPHYHAILFNLDFEDKILWRTIRGNPIYTSHTLGKIWGQGFVTTTDVSFQSAAYVARYILKKQTGDFAKPRYELIDPETGEVTTRHAEYTTMSRNPGVGAGWFKKFQSDVFPEDFIVHEGKRYKTPRFYDKLLKRTELGEEYLAVIKRRRIDDAKVRKDDSTPSRLAVREEVQQSKIDRLKREEIT